jgi:hypothetical protein
MVIKPMNEANEPLKKPRGSPPNPNAGSGVFTIRTRVAEQRAITKHARLTLKISANEFFLQAVRKLMPAMWIEQGRSKPEGAESRPDICSKCGALAIGDPEEPLAVVKAKHQATCWSSPAVATADAVSDDSNDQPKAQSDDGDIHGETH